MSTVISLQKIIYGCSERDKESRDLLTFSFFDLLFYFLYLFLISFFFSSSSFCVILKSEHSNNVKYFILNLLVESPNFKKIILTYQVESRFPFVRKLSLILFTVLSGSIVVHSTCIFKNLDLIRITLMPVPHRWTLEHKELIHKKTKNKKVHPNPIKLIVFIDA